jgi:hypothetical protein
VAEQGGAYLDQVRARLAEELPHLGSPNLRPVQIIEVYARLIAVAVARAEFYGRLLAQTYEDEGIGALVGHKYAVAITRSGDTETFAPVAVSEEIRALAVLEAQERATAERLARDALRLGVDMKRVDMLREYGRTVGEVVRAFTVELGLDFNDPLVRRAAQRAVLAARQRLGHDYRSPDTQGARLTPEQQQSILDQGVTPFDDALPTTED